MSKLAKELKSLPDKGTDLPRFNSLVERNNLDGVSSISMSVTQG